MARNPWDDWLRHVESTGFRAQYQRALSSKFESLDEVFDRYGRDDPVEGNLLGLESIL